MKAKEQAGAQKWHSHFTIAQHKRLQPPARHEPRHMPALDNDEEMLNYTLLFLPPSFHTPLALKQAPRGKVPSMHSVASPPRGWGRCNRVFLKNKVSSSISNWNFHRALKKVSLISEMAPKYPHNLFTSTCHVMTMKVTVTQDIFWHRVQFTLLPSFWYSLTPRFTSQIYFFPFIKYILYWVYFVWK